MNFKSTLVCSAAAIFFTASCATRNKPYRTAKPAVHFVSVEKDVQLEVIDWGGRGSAIVLLAGGGNTAHVFDDFAPRLATHFHVYGITRRGFGRSQYSPVDHSDRLAKDVLAVLDSMKIEKPLLAGHSIAGVELTAIARLAPNRVSGLIYLEAAYPYAYSNAQSPSMNDFFNVRGPQQPDPEEKDLSNFKALQQWSKDMYGFQLPETELRHMWDSTSEGKVLRRSEPPGFAVFPIMLNKSDTDESIPLPSLVVFAMPHAREAWITENKNDSVREAGESYFSKIDSLTDRQAKAFENGVPSARIEKMHGMHHIFLSNEAEVINAMTAFSKTLK